MGPTLNAILNIGVTGIRAQQSAIAVTAHNIANVNTEGYTRQRATFAEEIPLPTVVGTFGMGVKFAGIQRVRQNMLDGNYRAALGQQSKYDLIGANARALQTALGDINGASIGGGLTNFFNALHDLTTGPEDMAIRQNVIGNAAVLTDMFHEAARQLSSLSSGLDLQANSAGTEINSILQQVASLNNDINRIEALGTGTSGDLRDQRDVLLDHLSAYMDISTVEQPNGIMDVSANGEALVTGLTAFSVQVVSSGAPPHPEIVSSNNVALATPGGLLSGLAQAYQDLDATQTSIDTMASTLITEVNNIHASGFDLNGNGGIPFFTGLDAASIAIDGAIKADPALIAAASTANRGNSDVAVLLAQLQDTLVDPPGSPNATLNDMFKNMQVKLGSDGNLANQLGEAFKNSVADLQGQRQSINGVSTDEELSNMISYQHAYEAAARVVTVVDEIMDMIINRMGRVGL